MRSEAGDGESESEREKIKVELKKISSSVLHTQTQLVQFFKWFLRICFVLFFVLLVTCLSHQSPLGSFFLFCMLDRFYRERERKSFYAQFICIHSFQSFILFTFIFRMIIWIVDIHTHTQIHTKIEMEKEKTFFLLQGFNVFTM